MAQILKSLGHKAEHISGESGERKKILERFHSGECTVLCNSMLLTEGYDEPSVDCVVCLRPTKIRSLYAQIIGRGTRTCEGKENLLVLDFLWQSEQHNLCHPANLIANKPDVAEQMTKIAEGGKLFDLGELEQEAECTARQEREKSLADAIRANSQKKSKLIDPMEFALFTHDDELQSYSPTFKWEREAPTQKQLQALERLQFNPKAIQSRGFASLLLGNAINRRSRNLATPKQIKILNRFGYKNAAEYGFDFATKLITDLANNGWRRKQWKEI